MACIFIDSHWVRNRLLGWFRLMNERVTAGDSSSFTTADTVGLNRNNLPRPTNRARNIVPPLRGEYRTVIRKNAYKLGREMIWSNVARLDLRSFESARRERAVLSRKLFATKTLDQQPRALPELKLDHLARMTNYAATFATLSLDEVLSAME